MTAPLAVALVGAGQMGANHARVISSSARARLAYVVDTDLPRARALTDRFGGKPLAALEDLLDRRTELDAVVVASSTETHVRVAVVLLEAGLPLFVEKPLAPDLAGAKELVDAAERLDLPLQCGFVERFNPAVSTALALLPEAPWHVQTVRHSPVAPRIATNVVHDLLIHDLDLIARLFGGAAPVSVAAAGRRSEGGRLEIVESVLGMETGVASCSASRVGQRKVRTMSIATSTMLVEVDLLRQDVTRYHHLGQDVIDSGTFTYSAETAIDIPFVRHSGEPLAVQMGHFLDLVSGSADAREERRSLLLPHVLASEVERAVGQPA